MTNDFVGREQELVALQEFYTGRESALVPIYGRRRVGKSELILQFLKGKTGVYFLGKKAQAGLQIREFLKEAATVLHEPLLGRYAARDWKEALATVTERLRGGEKLVIVLDEFQWIVETSPGLPSILQELWDRQWKADGRIMLILCGSYIGFMEREVLGSKSPLFGRRSGQILLRPFGYREAALFHSSYSTVDHARTYFICGGVPLYLRCFSPQRSVENNIVTNLLTQYSALYQEPDFLLREELREVPNYYAVLMAIASGKTSHAGIAQSTGLDSRALHYYLKQLVDLGYVARRFPLSDVRPPRTNVRYILEDPLLRFWFRFVYPNTSFALQMGPQAAYRARVKPGLDAYFGTCFERLCREALPALYRQEGVQAAFQVGEYWDKTVQIDVVGLREDNWTDLGECKWGVIRSPKRIEQEFTHRIERYPNARGATLTKRVFTRRREPRPSRSDSQVLWHGLEDLYAVRESGRRSRRVAKR